MQTVRLSILIPTIKRDAHLLPKLTYELYRQILPRYETDVEIIVDYDEADSIGTKRNRLLDKANGEYVAFIDSDDWISSNYIKLLMAITTEDCASLKGEYSVNGVFDGIFEHSLKYTEWRTTSNQVKYERNPNHLNCIRASIAKQFRFPETNHGEDHDWSTQIHKSGLIKTELYISEVIYYYRKITR